MTMRSNKETDITIYGATSFVAKHALRYLIQAAVKDLRVGSEDGKDDLTVSATTTSPTSKTEGKRLKITLAGRDETKLKALRESLIGESSSGSLAGCNRKVVETVISQDVVVADGSDLPALQEMAKHTVVVLNCAGPYSKYSSKVVQACATTGTDYVDITGETMWASQMRQLYGPDASKSGSRIISFCGYDSIPTDMAVYHAVQTLRDSRSHTSGNKHGSDHKTQSIQIIRARIWYQAYGVANGGTIATAADLPIDLIDDFTVETTTTSNSTLEKSNSGFLARIGTRRLRSVPYLLGDPLCLAQPSTVRQNPEFEARKNRLAMSEWMNQIPAIEKDIFYGVSMPFPMSVVNLKVVYASAVALGYGSSFTAHERFFPFGFTVAKMLSIMALVPVVMMQCCLMFMMSALYIPIIGPRLTGLIPPGTGMPDELCKLGSNSVYCKVEGMDANSGAQNRGGNDNHKVYTAYSYFTYQGDAGNYVTAQCVAEAALVLVLNRDELPNRSDDGFGTPAELLGAPLLKRFAHTTVRPVTIKAAVDSPLL